MNLIYKHHILLLILLSCFQTKLIHAQQNAKYTQYMYDQSVFNSAYIGSKEDINFFSLYSTQFMGIEGAPRIANLSFNSPIGNKGLTIGANYINDKHGAISEDNVSINLAYTIELNYDYRLAFGLKTTANLLNVDYNRLNIKDHDDPIMELNINNKLSPNFGAGLFAYSDRAYLGISIPEIFQSDRYVGDRFTSMKQKLHLYVAGGYVFDVNLNTLLKPAFLLKAVNGGSTQLDLTLNTKLYNVFTLGVSFSSKSSLSALTAFNIDKNWLIGYGISGQTSGLKRGSGASHEFFIQYSIAHRQKDIRFF